MARLFINRQELERIFGGNIEMGKAGIFVQDGGGNNCKLGNWQNWLGDEAIGQVVVKKKKVIETDKTETP